MGNLHLGCNSTSSLVIDVSILVEEYFTKKSCRNINIKPCNITGIHGDVSVNGKPLLSSKRTIILAGSTVTLFRLLKYFNIPSTSSLSSNCLEM